MNRLNDKIAENKDKNIKLDNENYNIENRGKDWHIDHVIPLSNFNLDDNEQQLIAFNWRNTMPLSAKENLSKNNKILKPQIEQHLKKLLDYHKEKNIEMPHKYIYLFANLPIIFNACILYADQSGNQIQLCKLIKPHIEMSVHANNRTTVLKSNIIRLTKLPTITARMSR